MKVQQIAYHSMELLVLKGLRQYIGGGSNGLAGIFRPFVQVGMKSEKFWIYWATAMPATGILVFWIWFGCEYL
jgi:hypothetical protein